MKIVNRIIVLSAMKTIKQQKKNYLVKNTGFTLIEILMVIGIIAILLGMSIVGFRLFEGKTELKSYAQNILTILELARTKTLASEDASQYGVYFEQNKYVLFKGDTYQEEAENNKTYQLPGRLKINGINLANENDSVVFQRISGYAISTGTIEIITVSQPATTTINIYSSGQIELEATASECCIENRVSDSRHIHLDLGWSIQNAGILTLYFSDTPEISINIDMVNYFDAGQTLFDWSDIVDVNGEDQELRIHTHFLGEFGTILCVHRDRDKNNKPLQIFIDAKDIISYTFEGEFLVGPYGGTDELQ